MKQNLQLLKLSKRRTNKYIILLTIRLDKMPMVTDRFDATILAYLYNKDTK